MSGRNIRHGRWSKKETGRSNTDTEFLKHTLKGGSMVPTCVKGIKKLHEPLPY